MEIIVRNRICLEVHVRTAVGSHMGRETRGKGHIFNVKAALNE